MDKKAKISVIVPIYNMEEYLQECLDTVLSQTLKDIEIICINDGSSDKSEAIIKENMLKDNRVKLISQENKGVAAARNAGLDFACGEFVIFMDPDDWYPDIDILETLYVKAKENNVLICGGSFSELNDKGVVTEFYGVRKKYAFEEDGIIYYKDYQFDYGYHRFIYNLEFLKSNDIYFPLYIRYQDPPFFVNAMIKAERFYALKKITYRYRVGHQNINWTERRLIDLLKGLSDNIRMSGEAGLEELHRITLERLGKNYINMYANAVADGSPELIRLICELYNYINVELLENDSAAIKYVNVAADIFKRAIMLEQEKGKSIIAQLEAKNKENVIRINDMKKINDDMQNSMSFKCGRAITCIPRKIRGVLKKN